MARLALLAPLLPLLLGGCGLKRVLPGKAVLDPQEVDALRAPLASGITYQGPPRQALPALPVQVFGLYYDLDVVVVSRHPSWDMHEYARVDLPQGPLWLAKDSRAGSLVQGIVADLPDIDTWLPEVPVPRRQGAIAVEDRSAGRDVDLRLAYENLDGQQVEVEVRGRLPRKPPARRNGNTMGHSAQAAAVALDLERMGGAGRVRVRFDGQRVGVHRLLGLVPMKFLLQQAQAGFAVTDLVQRVEGGALRVRRPGPGAVDPATGQPGWPTRTAQDEVWTAVEAGAQVTLELAGPVTTQRLVYVDGELLRAEVWQVGREVPVTRVQFHPAVADLRRAFTGTAESRFELEVNGQPGHATGSLRARWLDADTVEVALVPTAPRWFADRPMAGTLRWGEDSGGHLVLRRNP